MAEEVKKKLGFFGSIKWFFTEIMKIYSTQDSYFSKKRGMIFFLLSKFETMTMIEFGGWASIQFLVAGYMVNQIQSEKKASDVSNSADTTIKENQQ